MLCFNTILSLLNRGPLQEEAPALTNSNVRHPHLPPTRTQGPSRLSLHYPHQLSPWSSPCPPRQLCRSMRRRWQRRRSSSSLPPSLNTTHSLSSLHVSAPDECHDATATAASIITSSGSFLLFTNSTNEAASEVLEGKETKWWLSEAGCLPNPHVALLNFS